MEASQQATPPPPPAGLVSLLSGGRAERLRHLEVVAPRPAVTADWPAWALPQLVEQCASLGIQRPWSHQAAAAEHAWAGRHVVLTTSTASGKSLAYWLPGLTTLGLAYAARPQRRTATVLYLAPTKALAHDQHRALSGLRLGGLRPATLDGDCDPADRDWVRDHASYVLSNPDLLHRTVLPRHQHWARLLASITHVVVDECHHYRGVFGAHVAAVLRRLRRVCARYGSHPVFVLASASLGEPAATAARLTGLPTRVVGADGSPHGGLSFVLWQPAEFPDGRRRQATAELAELLGDLVCDQVVTLAFVRSRAAAESLALAAQDRLRALAAGGRPEAAKLVDRISAYRAGYLPEERRRLEQQLSSGELVGVAATNALELGMDIAGLDAVLLAGFPGTRASMWQQAGRAGRAGQPALAVLVARDDPLDGYLLRHPDELFDKAVEPGVFDPGNRHILGPHLCAAAHELALSEADAERYFGPGAAGLLAELVDSGMLRRRRQGVYWTRSDRPADAIDIRNSGDRTILIVEVDTGRVLGTVDEGAAHIGLHPGAVHLHRGESYRVAVLDLDQAVASVERCRLAYRTTPRIGAELTVVKVAESATLGAGTFQRGEVQITRRVTGYLKRRPGSGEVFAEVGLQLPERRWTAPAVWWTWPESVTSGQLSVDGAAHAVEHALLAIMPLLAICDLGDVAGLSESRHPDTDAATVFVHETVPGGAGLVEHGFTQVSRWLGSAVELVRTCPCATGCPSCIQSPRCGRNNDPLDKAGALRLLETLTAASPGVDAP